MPEPTTTPTPTQERQFTITRVFDAPRALVWRCWTDPDEAPAWLHPRGVVTPREHVDFDVRPGGRYRYTMVAGAGAEYPTAGTYREVSPPSRLVFTWGNPGDADEVMPLITVDLAEHGADGRQTRMTFRLEGFAGAPGDANVYDGWSEAFDLLVERLDGAEVR
jgi:uncharacterized protein YndB with AHSA1/START domain